MTEGLVSIRVHVMHGHVVAAVRLRRRRGVGCIVSTVGSVRVGPKRLIGVRGFFGSNAIVPVTVVVGRTAGAAARANEPEQAGAERESDGEPGRDIHILAHAAGDPVGFEHGFEGAGQGGVERG